MRNETETKRNETKRKHRHETNETNQNKTKPIKYEFYCQSKSSPWQGVVSSWPVVCLISSYQPLLPITFLLAISLSFCLKSFTPQKVGASEIKEKESWETEDMDTNGEIVTQTARIRWPNVGPTLFTLLGQRWLSMLGQRCKCKVSQRWPNMLAQRWPNVRISSKLRWPNVGPLLQ